MEPLNVTGLATNLFVLSDNLYRAVRFVRRAFEDPRPDGLYVRLITEQARFAEWKRHMGIGNLEDATALLERMPEQARESLMTILAPMEKYLDVSQDLLKRYGIEKPGQGDRRHTLIDKFKRVEFLRDRQKELTDLLDTLKYCNDGLLTIAQPAPGYNVNLLSINPIIETSRPTQQQKNREYSQFTQTGSRLQQAQLSHTTSQNQISSVSDENASKQKGSRGAQFFHPVIELLYSTSLDVLRTAALQYSTHKPSFEGPLHRLSLWGSGMFQGLITIDQALNQRSESVDMLRNNIAGTLAEIAITLDYLLVILGEPTNSTLVLRLRGMFSIAEISHLSLDDEPLEYDEDSEHEQSLLLEHCAQELFELIECLFWTLPTIEMVFKTVLARQTQNPALDEREMLLLKSESEISLSSMRPEPIKELLKVDLELIAAMRESLKGTKYVENIQQKDPRFDPERLYKELGEESAQVKYWTSKLAEGNHDITEETQVAMTLNLARIGCVFNAGYKPSNSKKKPPDTNEIQDKIRKCLPYLLDDEADEEAVLSQQQPIVGGDGNNISAALDVLKSSNVELRRLAGSKTPGMSYRKDFTLSEKKERKFFILPSPEDFEVVV